MANASPPFRAERYDLAGALVAATLSPLSNGDADALANRLVRIDPWRRLEFSSEALAAFLRATDDGAQRYRITVSGRLGGVVVIRPQWLAGPYLATLGLLPEFHRKGLGKAVMTWLDAEGRRTGGRNVWLCVSAFNVPAIALYQACGFTRIAELPDLIKDREDEILMRKRLL